MPCDVFSFSFVRLMMFLITSFCCLRCSLLLHHIGRLYSHFNPRCLQARHEGFPSSHFFLRRRHVKHPAHNCQQKKSPSAGSLQRQGRAGAGQGRAEQGTLTCSRSPVHFCSGLFGICRSIRSNHCRVLRSRSGSRRGHGQNMYRRGGLCGLVNNAAKKRLTRSGRDRKGQDCEARPGCS